MKLTKRSVGQGLLLGAMILMGNSLGANASPLSPVPGTCPPGWVPRPQAVNFQLGPCMPGTITPVLPQAQAKPTPGTCPPGWRPRPQAVNFQLGPCLPGTLIPNNPQPQAGLLLPAVQSIQLAPSR
ncbi:hypothetical protein NIES970_26310 [[Synechococcus] sp. NIES-970]|uniref:hypothetical protein n=1 Tax=Picosynechococcus sp. NKBG15041c TaxID=1407650 RepID=UPI0004135AF9|nr:hypothetical protein [Picosynechococcus sp. NKBG15041c]BAW97676.1 hypothetical protein NIES970_26310 [[Synechococcus] sp. NIES-970]